MMTDIQIVQSSPTMQDPEAREALQPKRTYRVKYPFRDLLPGQSFAVPYDNQDNIVKSLRSRARQLTTETAEYSVIVHEADNVIEVGRVK